MSVYVDSLVLLNAEKARAHVSESINRDVSRTTFYRWRKFLRLSAPYSLDHVEALAIYGKALAATRNAEVSKEKTVQILQERGL